MCSFTVDSKILMEHNIKTYREAKECLDKYGKVAVVKPTGTGKTYIALQIMQDMPNCKKIVLAPSKQFLEIMSKNESFDNSSTVAITYQRLFFHMDNLLGFLKELNLDIDNIGLLVLDEMHRVLARKWSVAVERLVQICSNAKLLGLTATPIRKDNKNCVDELFDGISVGNELLANSIKSGELPKLNYVIGLRSVEKELIKEIKSCDKYGIFASAVKDDYNRMKSKWEPNNTYKETLKRYLIENNQSGYIPNKESRHIIFFPSIKELMQYKDKVAEWFKEIYTGYKIKVYSVNSDQGNKSNFTSLQKFSSAIEKGEVYVLLAVKMVAESFHFDSVASITLFRHIESISMFIQRIGRGIAINGETPFVFDFIDNFEDIKSTAMLSGASGSGVSRIDKNIFNKFIDDTVQCQIEINELKNKINIRASLLRRQMHKFAVKYSALQLIPDSKLRHWMLAQYRDLRSFKDAYITKHSNEFRLTDFIEYCCGFNWFKQAINFKTLSKKDTKEFVDKLNKMIVCNMIGDGIKDFLLNYIDSKYFEIPNLDTLYEMVSNSNRISSLIAKKAIEAFRAGNSFGLLYNLHRCKENLGFTGCFTPEFRKGAQSSVSSVNEVWVKKRANPTDLFGLSEFDKAAVYKIIHILQNSQLYTNYYSKVDDFDKIMIYILDSGKRTPKNIFIDEYIFEELNLKFLADSKICDSSVIDDALEFFKLGGRDSIIAFVKKHSDFYTKLSMMNDRALSMNYYGVHDKYKLKELRDQAIDFISCYGKMYLCSEFDSMLNNFRYKIIPIIAYLTKDYTLCSRQKALNMSKLKNMEIAYEKNKIKVLEKNRKIIRDLNKLFIILAELNKDIYCEVKSDFTEDTRIFYRLLKHTVNNMFESFKTSEYSIDHSDKTILLGVYQLIHLYKSGINDLGIEENIIDDKEFIYKVDSMFIGYRLWRKITDTIKQINSGTEFIHSAFKNNFYRELTEEEEEAVEMVLAVNINQNDDFYKVMRSLDRLPYRPYKSYKHTKLTSEVI